MIARTRRFAVIGLVLLLLSGMQQSPVRAVQLTPDGGKYDIAFSGSRIIVRSKDSGINNREIYWNESSGDSVGAVQCATWVSGTGISQPGFVYRIAQRPDGGINAIVFAPNIWAHMYWIFAPKLFHTGAEYDNDWDSPPGMDLSGYLVRSTESPTYPLRVCASLDAGDSLCFAVAKEGDTLPPLSAAGKQGGCWQLRISDFYEEGQGKSGKNGGIFAGHVPPGGSLVMENLTLNGAPMRLLG